jgi:hypothetical protein
MWFKEDVKVIMLDDGEAGKLCRLPYPNHPKGCPNYGKRALCPPKAPALGRRSDWICSFIWCG